MTAKSQRILELIKNTALARKASHPLLFNTLPYNEHKQEVLPAEILEFVKEVESTAAERVLRTCA